MTIARGLMELQNIEDNLVSHFVRKPNHTFSLTHADFFLLMYMHIDREVRECKGRGFKGEGLRGD